MKLFVILLALACLAPLGRAETYVVPSTADDGSPGTLRWAITQANADPPGPHEIVITAQIVVLQSPLPPITSDAVTITSGVAAAASDGVSPLNSGDNFATILRAYADNVAAICIKANGNVFERLVIDGNDGPGIEIHGEEHHGGAITSFRNVKVKNATTAISAIGGTMAINQVAFENITGAAFDLSQNAQVTSSDFLLSGWVNQVVNNTTPDVPSLNLMSSACQADNFANLVAAMGGTPGASGQFIPINQYSIEGVFGETTINWAQQPPRPLTFNSSGMATTSHGGNHGLDLTGWHYYANVSGTLLTSIFVPNRCGLADSDAHTGANTPQAQASGDPVSMFSGELYDLLPPDVNLGGPMPLYFQRYYASRLTADGRIAGRLGHNWLHNFDWKLTHTTEPPEVEVVDWRGRVVRFVQDADQWVLAGQRRDVPFQLVQPDTGFVFGDPRTHRLYRFDMNGRLTAIEDGRGNTHTLTYEGNDLVNVNDGLGRALTFDYFNDHLQAVHETPRAVGFSQSDGELTQSFDSAGRTTTYIYGGPVPGLLTKTVRPENNTPFEQVFNPQGRVITQIEAGGHATSFVYTNSVTDEIDPGGNRRTYDHNGFGNLIAFTDEARFNPLRVSNNTNQQRINISDRRVTPFLDISIGYHGASGRPSAVTNADGTVLSFAYTNHTVRGITFHEVAGITYPDGATETFAYDTVGNLVRRVDRTGAVWTFGYNDRGQPLTATNPAGGVVTFAYNANGTLASTTDGDTGITLIEYDAQRRLSKVTHPDGAEELFTYDVNDRLLSVTDGAGNLTRFEYDWNGNLIHAVDAHNRTNRFEHDGRDRVVRTVDRLGNAAERTFNSRGLLASVTNGNGHVTTFTHDNRRRLAAIIEPGAAASWRIGYANDGVANSFTNPLNQVTRMTLNARRYEIGRTNPLGQVTMFGRDTMMRVTNVTDAIGRSRLFSYDGAGRLTSATQPGGPAATYTRNSLGRLTSIKDLKGSQWGFSYTPMGRLASATDPLNRTIQFARDSRGRIEVTAFADGTSVTNSIDAAGNVIEQRYSDGTLLHYEFDELNRLVSANNLGRQLDPLGRVINTINTASAPIEFGAAYDADGRLTQVTYNSGLFSVTYTYDTRDRLIGVNDSLTDTQLAFVYDEANRLLEIQRPNSVHTIHTYDAAGRLTRTRNGTLMDLQYTLDAAGQVSHLDYTLPLDPATFLSPTTTAWTYDPAHQISNAGYSYDARGRLVSAPGRTYQYDDASRLTAINSVTFAYNGFNDLLTRTENGTTTRFFYNHALGMRPIVAEKNETTDQFLRYYVWTPEGRLLYMIDAANGNAVRHYHFDRVGSTLALTDAAGAVTDSYAYTPFGELLGRTGTSEQPFLYIGQYGVRSELGGALYHMRARYYDPASGRFLTRDPIWPVLARPESLDPYQYAANNPLSFIDPRGLLTEERTDFIDALYKSFGGALLGGWGGPMTTGGTPIGSDDTMLSGEQRADRELFTYTYERERDFVRGLALYWVIMNYDILFPRSTQRVYGHREHFTYTYDRDPERERNFVRGLALYWVIMNYDLVLQGTTHKVYGHREHFTYTYDHDPKQAIARAKVTAAAVPGQVLQEAASLDNAPPPCPANQPPL